MNRSFWREFKVSGREILNIVHRMNVEKSRRRSRGAPRRDSERRAGRRELAEPNNGVNPTGSRISRIADVGISLPGVSRVMAYTRPVYIPNRNGFSRQCACSIPGHTSCRNFSLVLSFSDIVCFSLFLVWSLRVRAGRSAGTPEIMFGRTAQHRGEERRGKVRAGGRERKDRGGDQIMISRGGR